MGKEWASFSRNCRSQGKSTPHVPVGERRPTFLGSGVEQSPPSTGFLPFLTQGHGGGGSALGIGHGTQPRRSIGPKVASAPLFCALDVGPGDCPGALGDVGGWGGREVGVCSAVSLPGSALALWTSIALTPSPGPHPSLPTHPLPRLLCCPCHCLALENGSSASCPHSIAPSLHYWFPAWTT